MRLSKTEKDEIAKLYRCKRASEEQELQDKLNDEVNELTAPIDKTIKDLRQELTESESIREQIIKDAGHGSIDRYGCMKCHPKLDKFRAKTNTQLMKLWLGETTTI